MKIVNIKEVKTNPKNPRIIKDDKFRKLVKSIQEFPDMLNKRPLIVFTDVDNKYVVLGGNMRLKACNELGIKEIPIIVADEWTEEQKNEFLIKDNVGFGEWDWDDLANEWDAELLNDWGLNVPELPTEVDYSILDDEDLADDLLEMANGVKKAIQIEFEAEHYEDAQQLVKFFRDKKVYVGALLVEKLKYEKDLL
jgi:ParB-like chromosome segregation protein Spo0J